MSLGTCRGLSRVALREDIVTLSAVAAVEVSDEEDAGYEPSPPLLEPNVNQYVTSVPTTTVRVVSTYESTN